MISTETIAFFTGRHRFLSNFYPCEIIYQSYKYANVECAYQAQKFKMNGRWMFMRIKNPALAKKLAQTHITKQRKDFHEQKLQIMEELLREKFNQSWFRNKLLATGDRQLVEGNTWGDTFWGVCDGVGENHLGKLLMKIRAELVSSQEQSRLQDPIHRGRTS